VFNDRTLHPQLLCADYDWMGCIPRRSEILSILWWTPTFDACPQLRGCALVHAVRVLGSSWIDRLKQAFEHCKSRAFNTLAKHPKATLLPLLMSHASTAVDQVALYGLPMKELISMVAVFQRACLDILGICNYLDTFYPRLSPTTAEEVDKVWPVDKTVMGAFTTSRTAMQNYKKMGIQTWIIRPLPSFDPTRLNIYVNAKKPSMVVDSNIVTSEYEDEPGNVRPFPAVYNGLPSTEMQASMLRIGFQIFDDRVSSQEGWDRLTRAPPNNGELPASRIQRNMLMFASVYVMALPPGSEVPSRGPPFSPSSHPEATPSPPFTSPLLQHLNPSRRPPLDPKSDHPPKIPIWVAALEGIDRSKRPALSKNSPFYGYRLPPSSIFEGVKTRKGLVAYQANWMATRCIHMGKAIDFDIEMGGISPQHWRKFLHTVNKVVAPTIDMDAADDEEDEEDNSHSATTSTITTGSKRPLHSSLPSRPPKKPKKSRHARSRGLPPYLSSLAVREEQLDRVD